MENDEKCLSLNAGGSQTRSGRRLDSVWEPVITQSETLPERERVLFSWTEKRGEMSRRRCESSCEERAKEARKKKEEGREGSDESYRAP